MRMRWLADLASFQIDYNEQTQRHCVGVTATVKVTLCDGVYHEDVGSTTAGKRVWLSTRYAFFLLLPQVQLQLVSLIPSDLIQCKQEAVTDALKHTLRNFGNLLGNRLYDKEYAKVCLRPLRVTWYPF